MRSILVMIGLFVVLAGGIAGCAEDERKRTSVPDEVSDALARDICKDGPLATPIADCAPAPLSPTNDPAADCVDRINQFRAECQCLPPLERWVEGESCAEKHARYDAKNQSPHAGFRDQVCANGGWAQNECPGWGGGWEQVNRGCLKMMWDEGPGEDFMKHGHYINMSNPNYTKVACGGADGSYVQNFR